MLLAEDDEPFARDLAALFDQLGWDAEVVHDGLAALGRLRQHPVPSLVCLDLVLPGIDGWRFYAEVRRNPTFPQVPILVLTGARSSPDDHLAGIVAFVSKPAGASGRARFEHELRTHLARFKT